jgi:hypothetical protein
VTGLDDDAEKIAGKAPDLASAQAAADAAVEVIYAAIARDLGLESALAAERARVRELVALLGDVRERLLDCAAMLHRDRLVSGSEKSDQTAQRARETIARIDAALAAGEK